MLIPKTKFKDPKYLKAMRDMSCLVCAAPNSVGHHVGHDRTRDDHALPLCGTCHGNLHNSTSEQLWWAARAPDIVLRGLEMWAEKFYKDEADG